MRCGPSLAFEQRHLKARLAVSGGGQKAVGAVAVVRLELSLSLERQPLWIPLWTRHAVVHGLAAEPSLLLSFHVQVTEGGAVT